MGATSLIDTVGALFNREANSRAPDQAARCLGSPGQRNTKNLLTPIPLNETAALESSVDGTSSEMRGQDRLVPPDIEKCQHTR